MSAMSKADKPQAAPGDLPGDAAPPALAIGGAMAGRSPGAAWGLSALLMALNRLAGAVLSLAYVGYVVALFNGLSAVGTAAGL